MPSGDKTLVCSRCEVAPVTIRMEDDTLRLRCPGCGSERARDVAIEAAGLYFNRSELKGLQDRQVRSTRRLKHVQYIPGNIPVPARPAFVFK